MKMKKIFTSVLLSMCLLIFCGLYPSSVMGEGCDKEGDILGLNCASEQYSGLSGQDPRVITVRIINFALSLLGIVSVIIILYAGFTWMTAGGNDEKVGSAKKILFAAVMGLIIILVSYSLTSFVLRSLCKATGSCGTTYGIFN